MILDDFLARLHYNFYWLSNAFRAGLLSQGPAQATIRRPAPRETIRDATPMSNIFWHHWKDEFSSVDVRLRGKLRVIYT